MVKQIRDKTEEKITMPLQEQKDLLLCIILIKTVKRRLLFITKTKQIQLYILVKGHAALKYGLQKSVAVFTKPNPMYHSPFYPPNTLDAMHLLSFLNLSYKALPLPYDKCK